MGPFAAAYFHSRDGEESSGRWVVLLTSPSPSGEGFPGFREVFESWGKAKTYLLRELQYLALDNESEEAWAAWEEARYWSHRHDRHVYEVTVGDPPGTYRMVRLGYEDA